MEDKHRAQLSCQTLSSTLLRGMTFACCCVRHFSSLSSEKALIICIDLMVNLHGFDVVQSDTNDVSST